MTRSLKNVLWGIILGLAFSGSCFTYCWFDKALEPIWRLAPLWMPIVAWSVFTGLSMYSGYVTISGYNNFHDRTKRRLKSRIVAGVKAVAIGLCVSTLTIAVFNPRGVAIYQNPSWHLALGWAGLTALIALAAYEYEQYLQHEKAKDQQRLNRSIRHATTQIDTGERTS